MKLQNQYNINKAARIVFLLLFACVVVSGCKKKNSVDYNKYESKGSGSISYDNNDFEIMLKNIFSGTGKEIDYLSDVDIKGDCTVTVDSSGVDTTKPGSYIAVYTVSKGNLTESEQIEVIIEDDENVQDDTDETAVPDNFKSEEVISDGVRYPEESAGTAKITLSNGGVAQIECTTKRYIVSTRTDNYDEQRGNHRYNISRLIITFNTGEERVLETIQKNID